MTYSANRELRKTMSLAFGNRAFKNDELDNQNIILDLVHLREQRAKLLGYDTHANFVLEERMAKNPETVNTFLNDLLQKAKPKAEADA